MVNGEPARILLVEDNPDHALLVRRALEDHQIANELWHVMDGEEALDFLFRRGRYQDPALSPRPHVVLLDLRLPRVDGLDVLKEIKNHESLRRIPVVVLTSSEAERDVLAAYRHFVNAYVSKPVDYDKFVQLMKDLGFFWLVWNVSPPVD
jgi:CheY-like chemotaxis protein